MSAEELAIAAGKSVLEYVESKRKICMLRMELERMIARLETGAAALREHALEPAVINSILGLPTYQAIQALTENLQTETKRHDRLVEALRGLGLEI